MDDLGKAREAIEHVSDTALLTAAYRALEAKEADCLVHDPFAERLAGERGLGLAQGMPVAGFSRFMINARDRFLDDLLLENIRDKGIQTVLNIGAGLDTRPWRLGLPESLTWIEVDFSAMLRYKAERMSGVKPRCRLMQIEADISVPEQRAKFWGQVSLAPALMITEGVLPYLPYNLFEALTHEAREHAAIKLWAVDITLGREVVRANPELAQAIAVRRMAQFSPGDSVSMPTLPAELQKRNWRLITHRTFVKEGAALASARFTRLIETYRWLSESKNQPALEAAGVYLFDK